MELTLVGSRQALADAPAITSLGRGDRVCVVATAAAFSGADRAMAELVETLAGCEATFELLAAGDRRACDDPAVAARLGAADLVVALDGAALHARTAWRQTALATALGKSSPVAVGSVASVLGATMIDPRGGAPTTGLGLFDEVVVCAPSPEELARRTRSLVGPQLTLVEMGPNTILTYHDATWRLVRADAVVITRAGEPATL